MEGKVFFVTGAASGIGHCVATRLIAQHAKVALADIQFEQLRSQFTVSPTVQLHGLNVTDPIQWQEALTATVAAYGRIDVVLNIAGVLYPNWIHAAPLSEIDRQVDINIKGVMYGTQLASKLMIEQGFGHIINVASMAGMAPVPGIGIYSATKFAVRGFTLAAAMELRDYGIAVTVISPTLVNTPMLAVQLDREETAVSFVGGTNTLTPDDVADGIFKAVRTKRTEICIRNAFLPKIATVFPGLNGLMHKVASTLGDRNRKRMLAKRQS